jgi:hypothetical protein
VNESSVTDADIAQVLAALSLNYNRPLDDETTVDGLMVLWRAGIGGCAIEDVVAGLDLILLDEKVDRFPTVAQFRAAVISANRRRHRVMREASPEGTVECLTCLDSGWLDMGTDDRHQWWVRRCPKGCVPPLVHHRQRPPVVRSGGPARSHEQLQLSRETLEAAVAGQHRATGDAPF